MKATQKQQNIVFVLYCKSARLQMCLVQNIFEFKLLTSQDTWN